MGRGHPPAVDQSDAQSVLVVSPAMSAFETVERVDGVRTATVTPGSHRAGGGEPTASDGELPADDRDAERATAGRAEAGVEADQGPEDRPLVIVSRAHTAESVLEAWRSSIGPFPADFGIVSIGEVTRSVATPGSTIDLPQAHIRTVGAEDVTGIGIAIGETLSQYEPEDRPIVWFESLTPLLEERGLELTFRFLHVTLEEIRQANATAYVHVDSTVHDQQTITTLEHLFDDVLEFDQ